LYLFDYRIATTTTTTTGGGGLGGGAALCSALLISSRLQSNLAVFSLVFLAIELFILGPFCWRAIGRASQVLHSILTVSCTAGTAYILRMMHSTDDDCDNDDNDTKQQQAVLASVSFIAASVFVGLLCPMWLVKIHKFKAQINGPWDEAVPRLSWLVVRKKG
jgi:phosphatidylinositol glycan class C protein